MSVPRACVGSGVVVTLALCSAAGFAAEAPTKPPTVTAPAPAAKQDVESPPERPPAKVRVGGYLKPGAGIRYRADALPKDRLDYGFSGGAGLSVVAEPFPYWSGQLKLQFSSAVFSAVTGVQLFDLGGDGRPDGLVYTTKAVPGVTLREAAVKFEPTPLFGLRAGVMRIPFSLQQQSANTGLMFPTRARPNEIFLSGADFGAQLRTRIKDGHVIASLGAYNGDSLGLQIENQTARGLVLSGRVDANPLGDFALQGGDHARGPFRFGVGAGLLFRPATLFDERTGTEEKSFQDLRISGSIRVAARGFYCAAEYFRRQQLDDYSGRAHVADGAYAQAAFFFPLSKSFAVEPILRAGFVHEDQTFDPRLTGYTDAGINVFPVANAERPSDVKVTVLYLGERRFTEQEDAHGGALTLQLRF
jgi:hypothetical protein